MAPTQRAQAIVVVEVFDITDTERMRIACEIRTRVFVDEQGVPPEEEIDEHDRSDRAAVHVLARANGEAVGTGRFYARDATTVQIGRMAVLPSARGSGAGRALLEALVREAAAHGFTRAHLHAQLHAREFYVKAGFFEDGERLWDAGIEHVPMSLALA